MKNRITKFAAAAVIIIAAILGLNIIGGPGTTGVAWADTEAAFLAQSWVHLKYDNGEERWYDLETGKHFFIAWDGRTVFIDRILNIRQVYDPDLGEHISIDRPVIYKDGIIPTYRPKTAWESIVGPLEEMIENGTSIGRWEIERCLDHVNGAELIRFDRYYNDPAGRRLLLEQLWADKETRLPVKIWKRLQLAYRKALNRESITGEFDFPETGPSSIYDLGVSQDLPIVKNYDRVAEPSIIEVIRAAKAKFNNFPQQYRSIRWDNTRESEIEIVWRNGEKIHHDHYFNLVHPEFHLDLPANAEEIEAWAETQTPISVIVFDGEKSYLRRNLHPLSDYNDASEPTVRIQRDESLFSSSRSHKNLWPHANRNPARFQLIDDVPEELRNYIGLRIDHGDIRRDFYIDPEHDYIYVRWIWWKQRAGSWEKVREYEHSDFVRLPEGHWYATKRILITYPDPEIGTSRGGANWNIDIKLLDDGEYPPDTFNGEKLLEGAKVETY